MSKPNCYNCIHEYLDSREPTCTNCRQYSNFIARELSFPAPCYLATNRGFYCGGADVMAKTADDFILFTANIRKATTFNSFKEAEDCFKLLRSFTDSYRVDMTDYFAVVTSMQKPVVTSGEDSERGRVLLDGNLGYSEEYN